MPHEEAIERTVSMTAADKHEAIQRILNKVASIPKDKWTRSMRSGPGGGIELSATSENGASVKLVTASDLIFWTT